MQITRAKLTEPYAALLTRDFVRKATNEGDLIRQASTKAESGPHEPLSDAGVSIRLKLAGRPGRPANLEKTLKRLLEALLEPLGREARRRAADTIRRRT